MIYLWLRLLLYAWEIFHAYVLAFQDKANTAYRQNQFHFASLDKHDSSWYRSCTCRQTSSSLVISSVLCLCDIQCGTATPSSVLTSHAVVFCRICLYAFALSDSLDFCLRVIQPYSPHVIYAEAFCMLPGRLIPRRRTFSTRCKTRVGCLRHPVIIRLCSRGNRAEKYFAAYHRLSLARSVNAIC